MHLRARRSRRARSVVARGKAARKEVPRSRNAELDLRSRPDPIDLLEEQARSRVPELVPLRYGRMMISPFTFFRGAALIMASDLARTPSSGIRAQICGDAHLVNFGVFGTPERRLIFDVNDFDETLPGPWEWDVKRLAASLEIAGRSNGYGKQERRDIVVDAVRMYHETMVDLANKGILEVWYTALNVEAALDEYGHRLKNRQRKQIDQVCAEATRRDSAHALSKLTHVVNGARQIVSSPPLVVPLGELLGDAERAALETQIRHAIDELGRSLPFERRVLFEQYRFVELARKVVGVGSVGTRCWIALFLGADEDDPLFLQIKEAEASVLERFVGASEYPNHGLRVVAGQRLMQAASDLLLGWTQASGIDSQQRDFYVRQLRDWKGSFDVDEMAPSGLSLYGRLCAWTLARAHARSGDRVAIASYLGTSDRFEKAIATFSAAYADQNERDHAALVAAVRSGRVHAETG
ncbi:MAG: DUF2252 domain-containing protein, partial [Kofleriaceae bacterium]|nr:DUF2252 domain-containing protein [Kofleriaceae bacterium]